MSEFSNFCSLLREKSGMTIYHIAKLSGIERTALNRMIIGKRFPKYEDVELFCEVIRANDKEKQHLKELYLMEKVGRKCFENCRFIEKLLHELGHCTAHGAGMPDSEENPIDGVGTPFANGRKEVEALVHYVLQNEYQNRTTMEVFSNFPVEEDILMMAAQRYGDIYGQGVVFHHFLILNINPEKYYDSECNLKVLYHTLLWIFLGDCNYIPYYTYSPIMVNDLQLQMMPYYLVAGSGVILVSDDFQQGILLENPNTVTYYQEKMNQILIQMQQLFRFRSSAYPDYPIAHCPDGWQGMGELLQTLSGMGRGVHGIEVERYEWGIVIKGHGREGKTISIAVTESSLCEAFNGYFYFIEEMAAMQEEKMPHTRVRI